jgi:molecular chaperone GrpE (heat shock protein)
MTVKTLRLSEIKNLSDEELTQRASEFASGRHMLNGEIADLNAQIAEFETRYEMSSASMHELRRRQKLPETAELGEWNMLLMLRDQLASQ